MAINSVSQPAVASVSPPLPKARPEPVNADGSAIPDEILYHHRPQDIGDLSNQDVPDETESGSGFFGDDGLTFGDVLDVINPLQHIPVVSTLYRAITGDEISPGARVAGGALFGGPIGFAVATANAMVEASAGKDIGDTIVTALFGDADDTVPDSRKQVAATLPAATPAVAVADADPATVGIAPLPISLLPAKSQAPETKTALPAAAGPVLAKTAKMPFGGMGTMQAVPKQTDENDPVAALLQARAAVPLAGPIQGLGNNVRPRGLQPAPLPSISPALADKLSTLAAQNRAPKQSVADDGKPESNNPATVPAALMPQRMLDTLDRYERQKSTPDSTS